MTRQHRGAATEVLSALQELDGEPDPAAFARKALGLCVRLADAALGCIALGTDPVDAPSWSETTGDAAAAGLGSALSRGVIQAALSGTPVVTTNASSDPRFDDRESVRRNAIEAVVCVPVGSPARGFVYLQGGVPPSAETVALVALTARALAPRVDALLGSHLDRADPTAAVRTRLEATGIVGRSEAVRRMLESLAVVARTNVPVLLEGPTGVGKTLVARVLHDNGPRPEGPFGVVDCTLLHPERAAADLFGARRGAWTGLQEDRPGWFETAGGGTLFLDEIGDLPLLVQGQLLLALQSGSWTRMGETRVRRGEVRVVAATNVELDKAVSEGRFRADLFHRVAGFRIRVPPLAERREDIPLLASTFLATDAGELGVRFRALTPAALASLERRTWPGNLRELRNTLRRGLLWCNARSGDYVTLADLEGTPGEPPGAEVGPDDLRQAVAAFRRAHVRRVVEEEGGRIGPAARRLGIHRAHLYELLRPESDPAD